MPIHVGVFSADGVFDPQLVKAAGRPVFFNNNGIHPGEPEGIDVCMALLRDLCLDPARRAALGRTVLVYIPIYNVDGALNRNNSSRVNQNRPEARKLSSWLSHKDVESSHLLLGVTSLGCAACSRRSGIGNDSTPWRTGTCGDDVVDQLRCALRRAPCAVRCTRGKTRVACS